jgi:hypothetical protein
MHNQVTDRFKLVHMELVKALPAFGRTITAIENYSLEVFRGEFHRGSVRMLEAGLVDVVGQEYAKMKVYNGEIIFWVSLVSQPVSVSGHFTTKDKYVRVYDVTIDVVVSDPVLFIQGYRLGKDPISHVMNYCKSSLQDYASRTQHDKLARIEKLNNEWNNKLCERTGIRALKISHWSLRDDPKRKEIDAVMQEAERNKVSMMKQAEIQKLKEELERERDAEKKAFEREQKTLDHMHTLHLGLRETAAQELTDILRERIRYAFERNTPIDEVAEDSMKLLNAFHESLHRGSVIDSTLSSGDSTSSDGTFSGKDITSRGNPETDPLFRTSPNLSDLSRTEEKEAGKE